MQWLLVLGFLDLNALEDLKMEKKFKFLKNNIQQSSQRKMWFLNKKNKNLRYKI